jgi:hypothetical protein
MDAGTPHEGACASRFLNARERTVRAHSINEMDITLGLIGNPEPALRHILKYPGLGLTVR